MKTPHNKMTGDFIAAQAELFSLGMELTIENGEYRVGFRHGGGAVAFYTDDLNAALDAGRTMARAAKNAAPPIGPTGRRGGRRAMMYRHNRKIAAKRRREKKERAMILVELTNPHDLPSVREVASSYLLRLAVIAAFSAKRPIPETVDEAAAVLRDHSPTLWAFYSIEAAEDWADRYTGQQAEGVRYAVRHYSATRTAPSFDDLEPTLATEDF